MRRRAQRVPLLDLTESNPTRAGIEYPVDEIVTALADQRALLYEPDPRGARVAREAVAAYYARRGVEVDPARVVLTASTSEAYTFLFKLLCEPGDAVLVPVPSYPLFEHLAHVEAVSPSAYALEHGIGWRVDASALVDAHTPRARAVLVVSPNNPTGSSLRRNELDLLVDFCVERDLALVCDEVFADYHYGDDARRIASVAAENRALTFTLNGLSKVAGLPQLKLGWIVVNGPEPLVARVMERLEFIADLFLSVGTPVQIALPRLLEIAPIVRARILERVVENRAWLGERLGAAHECELLPADGGWYATLRVPRVRGEEELVLALVEEEGVIVQPGYFFDYPREGMLVSSLLTEPQAFRAGMDRAIGMLERSV